VSILGEMLGNLRSARSDHKAIARGMLLVSVFVLLAAVARAAREMAIAFKYGIGAEVDAFLFVHTLVMWPVGVWLSVLTVVLVPLAARIRRESPADLPQFRSELLGTTALLGALLALFAAAGLPLLLASTFTGLGMETLNYAKSIVLPLSWLAFLGVLIGLFSAWTLAYGRHLNTFLEGVPAVVVVAVLMTTTVGGLEPLVWGTIAGFALHLLALMLPLGRVGSIEWPRLVRKSRHWPAFWQGFGVVLVGQVLMSAIVIVDQFYAAHIGVGAIATIGYANRILALVTGLGALAASRSMLPVFSKAESGLERTHHVAAQWSKALFVLGTICLAFGWWLASDAIALLFERGAFTSTNTQEVANVLRYALLQVPFYFASLVLTSYLASRGRYIWILWSGVAGLFSKVLGNAVLVPLLGIEGIVIATAFTYAVNLALFSAVFRAMR
jgi:putative peptidoglycan lipid II flippase